MESISRYLHKKTNNTWLFLALSLSIIFLVWLRANPELFIFGESYLSNWKYTHYLFSYESGFVKRGLIGELISILPIYASYSVINIIAYSSVFILCSIFILIFIKLWVKHQEHYGFFLFMLLVLTSPATLQHFFYDVGRFDIYIYICSTSIMYGIYTFGSKHYIITFFLVSCFLSILILIHEATFFTITPLVLMFWHYIDSSKKTIVLQIVSFMIVFLLTYLVSTKGDYTALTAEDHVLKLQSIYGSRVSKLSVDVLHNISLEENIFLTIKNGLTLDSLSNHIYFLLFSLPSFYFSLGLYHRLKEHITIKIGMLFLSVSSPLALYPLGYDYFRWWSFTITNVILVIIFLCLKNSKFSEAIFKYFEDKRKLVFFIIVLGFISGPLEYIKSFSIAENLNQTIDFLISLI